MARGSLPICRHRSLLQGTTQSEEHLPDDREILAQLAYDSRVERPDKLRMREQRVALRRRTDRDVDEAKELRIPPLACPLGQIGRDGERRAPELIGKLRVATRETPGLTINASGELVRSLPNLQVTVVAHARSLSPPPSRTVINRPPHSPIKANDQSPKSRAR